MKKNITYIYPLEKRKAVLKKEIAKTRIRLSVAYIRLSVAYLKKYYNQALRNYHAWRIEEIKKKRERLNRRHEKRLAKLEKRYNK